MKHTCCWVHSKPAEFPVKYCGKKVRYKIIKDDDNNDVRRYNAFCDEHQKLADAQPDEDDWGPRGV